MSDDRTEKPSPQKLKKAREEGKVARSKDLAAAVALAAGVAVLGWTGTSMARTMARELIRSIERIAHARDVSFDGNQVSALVVEAFWILAQLCGPVALATMITVVAVQVLQGGFLLTTKQLQPKLSGLSPMTGLRRLAISQSGPELLKAILITTTLIIIGYQGIKAEMATSIQLSRMAPLSAAQRGWAEGVRLLQTWGLVLFIYGLADYGYQRWRFLHSQKMTKSEVKSEGKDSDGNPQVKGRIRQIQMAMVRKRMLAAVPGATVVVTNPTHYAVALQYHRGAMNAPKVVAKGQNLIAQRIKAIAREHGVPVVENPPLARALFASVEIGEFIPGTLFEAVAEVLAYLIKLRQLAL